MQVPLFDIRVDRNPFAEKVCLSGEIDFAASLELKPKIDEITGNCDGDLLLDLSQVTFIDSEGIKTLISMFRRMHEKQSHARVISCSPCVRRVMKLAGVDDILMASEYSGRI